MDSLPFYGTSKPLANDEAILELPAEDAFCKKFNKKSGRKSQPETRTSMVIGKLEKLDRLEE